MTNNIYNTLRSGSAILAFSLFLSFNAFAQTCATQPTCESLGYIKTATECFVDGIKCPFDTSKMYCGERNMDIGDILYSDMTYSPKLVSSKTPIGVIFDTINRKAIALDTSSSTLTWGGSGTDLEYLPNCTASNYNSCDIDSGAAVTYVIITYGKNSGIKYPAAEYASKFKTTGTSEGDWYLPTTLELSKVNQSSTPINKTLSLLGKKIMGGGVTAYWSSTEYSPTGALAVNAQYGTVIEASKSADYGLYARPVISF